MPRIEIINCFGHYEVHVDGKFYSSADTYSEALNDVKELNEKEMFENNGMHKYD